jgi:hypothetical protein
MSTKISDIEKLSDQLARAYWIEDTMEGAITWKFLKTYETKHRDLIKKLSKESAGHRTLLKLLCIKIEGLDVEEASKGDLGLSFEFKNKLVEEILDEIMKYDKMALSIYKKLYNNTDKEFISSVWKGKDSEEYFQTILRIMNDEIEHVEALYPHVGKIERIK